MPNLCNPALALRMSVLFACAALCAPAARASTDTQTGIFVSYSIEADHASLTIQQASRPAVFAVAADASARERAAGESWQAIALSALQPGEPVTVHFGSDGRIHQVDADYASVLTRLVISTKGYIITTSGQTYKLIGKAAEAATSLPLGAYLKLRVDPQTASVFDIATASQPFTSGNPTQRVTVTFVVTVPANTPPTDIIYLASSVANWTPNGLRLSPSTGNRWTAAVTLGSGSSLEYRYTRGSWSTDERNAAGVEIPNRNLSVTKTGDAQTVNDSVVRWADLAS